MIKKIFEEMKEKARRDIKIEKENILNYYNRNELVFHYLTLKKEWKSTKNILMKNLKAKRSERWVYYKTEFQFTPEKVKDLNLLLDGDVEILEIQDEIQEVDDFIEFLSGVIEILKSQVWEMKNYIDSRKYFEGE